MRIARIEGRWPRVHARWAADGWTPITDPFEAFAAGHRPQTSAR